jgi:putative membrane protein
MKCSRWAVAACLAALVVFPNRNANAIGSLDDATILAVFDQANEADILTGRLGAKYGSSEDVRALGRMVASDHVAVQRMARDLSKKLNIVPTPPDNDASVSDYARAVSSLQSKRGAAFDRAYLQHEVAFHQSVVEAIKGTLLPAVRNDEIRKLLNSVLPGFESHLAATKAAARKMGVL